jgi:hypothetical protein
MTEKEPTLRREAVFRLIDAVEDAQAAQAEQTTVATADVDLLLTYLQTLHNEIEVVRNAGGTDLPAVPR